MNVSLTRKLEKFIHEKVASGLYHSASEVIREGLRRLREEVVIKNLKLKNLRHDISIGLKQSRRGDLELYSIKGIKKSGKAILKQK